MQESIKDRAQRMASEGRTAVEISQELGIDYWEVWSYVPGTWRGTKQMITRRINRLVNEDDPSTRKELAREVKEYIDYLYKGGMRLGRIVDRARKTLGG